MKNVFIALVLVVLFCCKEHKEDIDHSRNDFMEQKVSDFEKIASLDTIPKNENPKTRLQDSITVGGNTIIVLRPDSLRFQFYIDNGEEWIYEVDSDFGFRVSAALDDFERINVSKEVTEKRFIQIVNCDECPLLIDRDSIDYGIIMIGINRKIKIDQNIFGKEYYLQLFEEYFEK